MTEQERNRIIEEFDKMNFNEQCRYFSSINEDAKRDDEILNLYCQHAIKAVTADPVNFLYMTSELAVSNPDKYAEIAVAAANQGGFSLYFIVDELLESSPDKYAEIAIAVVNKNGEALQQITREFAVSNPDKYAEIAIAAVKKNGRALQYMPKGFAVSSPEKYVEVAIVAVNEDNRAIRYLAKELLKSNSEKYAEIAIAAVKQNGIALEFVAKELAVSNPEKYAELAAVAVNEEANSLKYVAKELAVSNFEKYKEIATAAINKKGSSMNFVPAELAVTNPEKYAEIATEAVSKNKYNSRYITKHLAIRAPHEYARLLIESKYSDYKEISTQAADKLIIKNEKIPQIIVTDLPKKMQEIVGIRKLGFTDLQDNPDWVQHLKGKSCEEVFEEKYIFAFKLFGSQCINMGLKDIKTLDKMVDNNNELLMGIWKDRAGFVPSHIIMENFPLENMDSFIKNKEAWAKIAQNPAFQNDEPKVALLNLCFTTGVFEGKKEVSEKVNNLINNMPKLLDRQSYELLAEKVDIGKLYEKKTGERYVFGRKEHAESFEYRQVSEMIRKMEVSTGILTKEQFEEIIKKAELSPKRANELFIQENGGYKLTERVNFYELATELLYQIGEKPENELTREKFKQLDQMGKDYINRIFTKQEDGTYKFNMKVENTEKGEIFLHDGQTIGQENIDSITRQNKKLFDYTQTLLRENRNIAEADMLVPNARHEINMVLDQEQMDKILILAEEIKEYTQNGYTLENEWYQKRQRVDSKEERGLLEQLAREYVEVKGIMTPNKAHRVFDSLKKEYDADFAKFLLENIDDIVEDKNLTKRIANIQERFSEISAKNPARKITLDVALTHISDNVYPIIPGFEEGAEYAKNYGYSLEKYNRAVEIWKEAKNREESAIPRVQGKTEEGWTYEILRLDDPMGIFIGEITDCCQVLDGAGQDSMRHSMGPGRVLVIKNSEGQITGQGWVWEGKNPNTHERLICIDNIETPKKRETYETSMQIKKVTELFAENLMQKDDELLKELAANGKMTPQQYKANKLGAVTLGLGYLYGSLSEQFKENLSVQDGDIALPDARYTDAKSQVYIKKRPVEISQNTKTEAFEKLALHRDELNQKQGTKISTMDMKTIRNMEESAFADNPKMIRMNAAKTVNDLAQLYNYRPDEMGLVKGADWYMVYAETEDNLHVLDTARLSTGGINARGLRERKEANNMIFNKAFEAGKTVQMEARDTTSYKIVNRMIEEKRRAGYEINVLNNEEDNAFGEKMHNLKFSVASESPKKVSMAR